jgi:hypothetical protein
MFISHSRECRMPVSHSPSRRTRVSHSPDRRTPEWQPGE